MKEIKNFINSFFNIEAKMMDAYVHPDYQKYNQLVDEYNTYYVRLFHSSIGKLSEPLDDDVYEEWKDEPIDVPRHLFKLSEYEHPKYGKLYLAYVSNTNPTLPTSMQYFHCFYITKVDGDWKIVKKSILADNIAKGTRHWSTGERGYGDVSFTQAGKFIRTERYMEPSACEFSMKDYLKDK